MKASGFSAAILLLACLACPLALFSQDNVTIPKSRLDELERKERELEQLKQPTAPPTNTPRTLKPTPGSAQSPDSNVPVRAPVVSKPSPPIASLPPIKEGEVVEATDLANYYRQDVQTADQRFKRRTLTVRGEIAGFEKPMLRRDYHLLLQTGDRELRIVCNLFPPDKFNSVYTIKQGSELVGLQGQTQTQLAKLGQNVMIRGKCNGFKEGAVRISGVELQLAR